MHICNRGHCTIVFETNSCPLCSLTSHNNTVHDFIESNGRSLVNELVAFQNRKISQEESPATSQQQTQNAILRDGTDLKCSPVENIDYGKQQMENCDEC